MVFWRIARAPFVTTAFTGQGARRNPGRWNHVGVPVVYCGSSLSLSTLEYLVHTDPDDMPADLMAIRAELPDSVAVERVAARALPPNWREYPGPAGLQTLGSEWAARMSSVALVVPSAVTPIEDNIILNPLHPDIAKLTRAAPVPFAFDARLIKLSKAKP